MASHHLWWLPVTRTDTYSASIVQKAVVPGVLLCNFARQAGAGMRDHENIAWDDQQVQYLPFCTYAMFASSVPMCQLANRGSEALSTFYLKNYVMPGISMRTTTDTHKEQRPVDWSTGCSSRGGRLPLYDSYVAFCLNKIDILASGVLTGTTATALNQEQASATLEASSMQQRCCFGKKRCFLHGWTEGQALQRVADARRLKPFGKVHVTDELSFSMMARVIC